MAILALAGAALGGCAEKTVNAREIAGADPARGLTAIKDAGCAACHQIPGVAWPQGTVGGSLAGFATQPLIAGRFPNRPDVLARWLRDAPSMAHDTAMPPSGLNEAQALDAAAYLYGLDDR